MIDPADLAWIWLTHDDADHTGSLQTVLDLAPQAKLATHGLGALRMNTCWPVPLDRVHAVAAGDRLDVGDRILRALRPPTYDNPMSTGFFDESTATFFSVDSFGAILPGSVPGRSPTVPRRSCVGGMVAWATFDSPWLHLDRSATVSPRPRRRPRARRRAGPVVAPAAGRRPRRRPARRRGVVPDAEPFVAPDAAAFDADRRRPPAASAGSSVARVRTVRLALAVSHVRGARRRVRTRHHAAVVASRIRACCRSTRSAAAPAAWSTRPAATFSSAA